MDPPDNPYLCDGGEAHTRDQVALAILFEVEQPEGRTAVRAQARNLVVASADGQSITTIADSIEGLLGHHQVSKESVLVFYVKDGAARVLDLDPVARVVRSDAALSSQK
jgi:hypothetical protein